MSGPIPTVELSLKSKLFVGICALASTAAATVITNVINQHFATVQAEVTASHADVQALEAGIEKTDNAVRIYIMALNEGAVSKADREAALQAFASQWALLNSIAGNLPASQRPLVRSYQAALEDASRNLRRSIDIPSTVPFAAAVARSIDERIKVQEAFRSRAGMGPPLGRT